MWLVWDWLHRSFCFVFASFQLLPFATTGVKLLQNCSSRKSPIATAPYASKRSRPSHYQMTSAIGRTAGMRRTRYTVCVCAQFRSDPSNGLGWMDRWLVSSTNGSAVAVSLPKNGPALEACSLQAMAVLPNQASLTLQTRAQNGCADGMLSRLSRHICCIWRTAAKWSGGDMGNTFIKTATRSSTDRTKLHRQSGDSGR